MNRKNNSAIFIFSNPTCNMYTYFSLISMFEIYLKKYFWRNFKEPRFHGFIFIFLSLVDSASADPGCMLKENILFQFHKLHVPQKTRRTTFSSFKVLFFVTSSRPYYATVFRSSHIILILILLCSIIYYIPHLYLPNELLLREI